MSNCDDLDRDPAELPRESEGDIFPRASNLAPTAWRSSLHTASSDEDSDDGWWDDPFEASSSESEWGGDDENERSVESKSPNRIVEQQDHSFTTPQITGVEEAQMYGCVLVPSTSHAARSGSCDARSSDRKACKNTKATALLASLKCTQQAGVVDETYLVRCCLLAIQGFQSRAFQLDRSSARPRSRMIPRKGQVAVSHLSPSSLMCCLDFFADFATTMLRLEAFMDPLGGFNAALRSSSAPSLVLQSFSCALNAEIGAFREYLGNVERMVQRGGKAPLASDLASSAASIPSALEAKGGARPAVTLLLLENWLRPFERVYRKLLLLSRAVYDNDGGRSAAFRALTLTREEFATEMIAGPHSVRRIALARPSNDAQFSYASCTMRLLAASLKPYLRTMTIWLAEGQLVDPGNDFFVSDKDGGSPCPDYEVTPVFFRGVSEVVFKCGLSVRSGSAKQKGAHTISVLERHYESYGEEALNTIFLDSLRSSSEAKRAGASILQSVVGCIRAHHAAINDRELKSIVQGEDGLWSNLGALRSLYFLEQENQLMPFLIRLYQNVEMHRSPALGKRTFSADGVLDEGIETLMSAELTQSMRASLSPAWESRGLFFRTEGVCAIDPDRVTVTYAPPADASRGTVSSTRPLMLYDNLDIEFSPSPRCGCVISSKGMREYKQVFRFLLKLKHTKYVLCRAHHGARHILLRAERRGERRDSHYTRLQCATLFLAEHHHFISNMHDYVMHRIVSVSWSRLRDDVQKAETREGIVRAHNAYLENVCVQCLLSRSGDAVESPVVKAVSELISCCLRFSRMLKEFMRFRQLELMPDAPGLTRGSDAVWDELVSTHKRFQNSNRFLLILLDKRVGQGGVSHLSEILERLDYSRYVREGRSRKALSLSIHAQ